MSILSSLGGVANTLINHMVTGDTMKDYAHGQRLFVDSLYRLSPKYKFLFHVYFDLNKTASKLAGNQQAHIELGMLAKTVQLPKFTIQNKVHNAYNRKNIAQERINYDPVTMTFHDDSADVVRSFWYDYYQYYYRDSDYSDSMYTAEHKYKKRQQQAWGYSPRNNGSSGLQNYLNSIRIYSLHQKKFTAYTLINPVITSFSHGEHQQGANETMEHNMTISYEAVHYTDGAVSSLTTDGFGTVHYDHTPGPLSSHGGSTASIFGPAGLVDNASDVINNLNSGNYLGAALTSLRTYNTFKNADLKGIASATLLEQGASILTSQNTQSSIFVPTIGSINSGIGKAVHALPGIGNGGILNINNQNTLTGSSNQQSAIPGF